MNEKQLIRIAHSPDPDDAFMFWGLATDQILSDNFRFDHTLKDIQTLNEEAKKGTYEVSAISFHAYPEVADQYLLMPCGASMGINYGPMVVTRKESSNVSLSEMTIAVPGLLTTAFLVLKLFEPNFKFKVLPFDQILQAVAAGEVDAGLIIHEGQLTYSDLNLEKRIDLGEWWYEKYQLPLPLGGNVIRKDLGRETILSVTEFIQSSIRFSLKNREPALQYALQFGRDLSPTLADRFVGMYVNDLTVEYGETGRASLHRLFEESAKAKLIKPFKPEFVG